MADTVSPLYKEEPHIERYGHEQHLAPYWSTRGSWSPDRCNSFVNGSQTNFAHSCLNQSGWCVLGPCENAALLLLPSLKPADWVQRSPPCKTRVLLVPHVYNHAVIASILFCGQILILSGCRTSVRIQAHTFEFACLKSCLNPSHLSLLYCRTRQGSSGLGSDAGADHSDGVSEQNEGTAVETHLLK